MSERVTMPALGESVTEGTVTRWLKSVGDQVAVDEPLLEVSTDKVDTEIPSPVAGTVQEIFAHEDDTVPVGADLCVIGDGEAPAHSAAPTQDAAQDTTEPAAAEPVDEQAVHAAEQAQQGEAPVRAPGADNASSDGQASGGTTVVMPALGESVTEGTVTRWLKKEGDEVAADEPLLEVSTDKVDTEIPAPAAGRLTKILAQEDDTVAVGGELAIIGGEVSGAAAPAAPAQQQASSPALQEQKAPEPQASQPDAAPTQAEPQQKQATPAPAQQATAGAAPAASSAKDADAYVTPLVRKLASQHGVSLSEVEGTGVGGRIRKQDVLDAAAALRERPKPAEQATPAAATSAPASAPAAPIAASAGAEAKRGTTEKMSRLRKVIAERMVDSLAISAQLTAAVEVDMTKIAALRARAKDDFQRREGVKLTYLPFIALATIEALKAFPEVNASVETDTISYHADQHLGIAVDTDRGLLVPVIKDAGTLNISGISKKIADLADRTRTNKVTPDELGGGTFTITNIGSNGSLLDTPIINQPNVGILGTGAIVKRPAVITDAEGNDAIAIRSMMYLVLTYDHRVIDGALAGRFLSSLKARLEEGSFEGQL